MTERRKMPGWVRVTLFVAILVVILAAVATVPLAVGYFRPPPTPGTASGPVLRVIPSELFRGELKRIEPHLGLTTGCVKLEPIDLDPEIEIGMRVEVRRIGQPTKEWSRSSGPAKNPQEASFSLRETNDPDDKKRYRLITALLDDSPSSHTIHLPDFWPKPDKFGAMSWTNSHLHEPVDLAEKVEVPVWAFYVHDNGRAAKELQVDQDAKKTAIRSGNRFEDEINSSPCALVVSLWWEYRRR